jgi:Lar family restriction alleviation protein
MEHLKPCPFCSSKDVRVIFGIVRDPITFTVMCKHCFAKGPVDFAESGAMERWDNRPLDQQEEIKK